MPGRASLPFSKMQRLAFLVSRRPSYLLGRFATVRDIYSRLNWLKDAIGGAAPLRIGDLYHPADTTIDVAISGHVLSGKTAAQQIAEMRAESYSMGPHLDAAALAELQRCARTLPLHFNEADVGTYEELSRSPGSGTRPACR
jgi:L-ascorbate metabolism protein UlaG (beta-lactamase superfamily)